MLKLPLRYTSINSGEIGDVKVIKADLSNLVTVDYESRLFANGLGGGALLDVSVYLLSFATAILGNKPQSINSSAYIRNGIDFDNHITLQYQGAYADLPAGMSAYSPNHPTIIGTNGLIQTSEHFYQAKKLSVYDCDYNLVREIQCDFDYTGFEYQILECEKMIREHKITSKLYPLNNSLAVMNIIDSCKQQWNLRYPGDEN